MSGEQAGPPQPPPRAPQPPPPQAPPPPGVHEPPQGSPYGPPHAPQPAPRPHRRPRTSPASWLAGQVPYALVLCGVAGGLALFAMQYFRKGSTLLAAAVICGAAARMLLPESRSGMLVTRKKWLDVLMLAGLGVAIAFVAWVVPPK